jgi:hypothetical protein
LERHSRQAISIVNKVTGRSFPPPKRGRLSFKRRGKYNNLTASQYFNLYTLLNLHVKPFSNFLSLWQSLMWSVITDSRIKKIKKFWKYKKVILSLTDRSIINE